jgi:long-chain acyl-CoA synthetase
MLYDCWRQVALRNPNEIALSESGSGRRWTFGEVARLAEQGTPPTDRAAFPSGLSADFIFAVLRAWRWSQIVCPVEPGQQALDPAGIPPEVVHLKTTSASTGAPSFVALTSSQLMADAQNIVETMGLRRDWPNLGVISLAHSYGFSNLVLPLLLHGIPLVLVEVPLPETLKRAAAAQDAVTLAGVPALWRAWHDAGAIPPNVRLAISAGAPLPLALEQSVFSACGLKIHNFYGSSECGGIAYDSSDRPRDDGSYVGLPMRHVKVSVAENGCLDVRSRAVALSYWPEPASNLRDGVFHTSDLGEVSAGRIYLRGRASDQINVAGRKVSPETIEQVLLVHPAVRGCVVFGAPSPDTQRTETVVACVAVQSGINAEKLRQFALERLPAWQVPRQWWLVESLQPNIRGKLSRADWRRKFLQENGRH